MSGNDFNDEQPSNKLLILFISSIFQFDISGNDIKNEHPLNIEFILLTFFIFHTEISVNSFKDVQSSNKLFILFIFSVFHLDRPGNDCNDEHPLNIPLISVTLLISKKDKSKYFKFLQFSNTLFIILTFLVLNENKLIFFISHP